MATVRTKQPNDTAWQRFLGTGPLALLPVRDSYSNVVWSTSVAEAARLEALTPQEFALNVNQVGILLLHLYSPSVWCCRQRLCLILLQRLLHQCAETVIQCAERMSFCVRARNCQNRDQFNRGR